MGAGIGGAVRRRSGEPRRAPVEAVRGLDQTGPGAELGGRRAAPAARDRARCPRRRLHDRDVGARVPLPRRPPHRSHRRLQPALPEPDRCRRPPAHRGRARGRARLVLVSGRQGRAVRRRLVGRVGRQPARRRCRRHRRHGPLRPRARRRHDLARGPHPGRNLRTGAGGPVAAARIHAASLPAELPLLDARRLDRHALGRPLRDEPHPHRRLRRVGAHAHAAGLVGEPASPRLGCWAQPRSHGDRQRRDPRRDHRGVDARPAAADVPRHRRHRVPDVGGGHRCGAPDRPGQAVAGELPDPRPGGGRAGGRPRRHGVARHRQLRVRRALAASRHRHRRRHRSRRWWRHRRRRRQGRRWSRRADRPRRQRRRVARRLHRCRPGRRHQPRSRRRHVRDGDHVGPVARLRRRGA